jgi:hypothetical protein
MSFDPHSLVQLLSDAEVPAGSYGHVVEAFDADYEVEFVDEEGEVVRILVPEHELVAAEPQIDKCS